ncbi:Dual specificity phosphatase catalytic domain [Trinorchestia longiramus]|nr:Dual specificity phosphatase catalytic domain [Trinorchestia longiramus]
MQQEDRIWRYSMRRQMQEVFPGLFLGPLNSVCEDKLPLLRSSGISHILCVRSELEASVMRPKFPQLFTYLEIHMSNDTPLSSVLSPSLEFISRCIDGGGRCLIQGFSGACRSAAIAVAFIMFRSQIGACDALQEVSARRFCLTINPDLLEQLKQYDEQTVLPESALEKSSRRSTPHPDDPPCKRMRR